MAAIFLAKHAQGGLFCELDTRISRVPIISIIIRLLVKLGLHITFSFFSVDSLMMLLHFTLDILEYATVVWN